MFQIMQKNKASRKVCAWRRTSRRGKESSAACGEETSSLDLCPVCPCYVAGGGAWDAGCGHRAVTPTRRSWWAVCSLELRFCSINGGPLHAPPPASQVPGGRVIWPPHGEDAVLCVVPLEGLRRPPASHVCKPSSFSSVLCQQPMAGASSFEGSSSDGL